MGDEGRGSGRRQNENPSPLVKSRFIEVISYVMWMSKTMRGDLRIGCSTTELPRPDSWKSF